jgi:hypothetical protein
LSATVGPPDVARWVRTQQGEVDPGAKAELAAYRRRLERTLPSATVVPDVRGDGGADRGGVVPFELREPGS